MAQRGESARAHKARRAGARRAGAGRRWLSQAALGALVVLGVGTSAARAQSQWDSIISNTNWYVPVPLMLAYGTSGTSFANPFAVGDQTLWALGTSTNGVFTGTSSATLAIGPFITTSSMTIQGTVTSSGQVTMLFDNGAGLTTVGLGVMQQEGGVTTMEMQMITGDTLMVTHWAYMTPYDPATFTPPAAQVVPGIASPQWAWTQGTPWRLVSPSLLGTTAAANIVITTYSGGYFWGKGVAPGGGTFTFIGSMTPQGKVLLSTVPTSNPVVTNLYGDIEGNPLAAQMQLGVYDSSGTYTGQSALVTLVQPYVTTAAVLNPAATGAAVALYRVAGTPEGLVGPLAPAISVLNALEGPALATALGQALPALAANASRATYDTQRPLQQIIASRIATRADDASGKAGWAQPFGALSSQSTQAGYSGYDASGGGFVAGVDGAVTDQVTLGGWFAYSYAGLTGNAVGAPSSLDVSSYALGLYGSTRLAPGLSLDVMLDGAFNDTSESRSVGLAAATASADYTGTTFHAGAALRQDFQVSQGLRLTPTVRLDYATVHSPAYVESGAGALSLSVAGQTYQELMVTAGVRGDYRLSEPLRLTGYAGVGYNLLDTGTQVSASFLGGGPSFTTFGADLSPWLFSGGIGLVGTRLLGTRLGGLDLGLNYDLQASPSGFVNQTGSLSLKLKL